MKPIQNPTEKAPGIAPQKTPALRQRWGRGNWQLWVGVGFSLGFFVLALRNVDLDATVKTLLRVNVLFLGAAVVNYLLSDIAKAIRWRWLLSIRKTPSLGRAFSVLAVGQTVNAFFPARLGEIARAYLMGETEAESKVYILGTVVLEKVADLLFLLLALVVILPQMALPEWLAGPARGTALIMIILVPCLLLLAWQKDFILRVVVWICRLAPQAWREWLVRQAEFGLTSLDAVRRPRVWIGCIAWSFMVWMLSAFTNYLVFLALDLTLPAWAALFLLVVLHAGTAVPSSPGRIGVFQYLVILALSLFAVDKNVALGYSVLLYLVIYVPIALIGSYCLWREKITWKKLAEAVAMLKRLTNRTR